MKKIILMLIGVVALVGVDVLPVAGGDTPESRIVVYYFHGSFRCPTCSNMEKYSQEAIKINFKNALSSGKLEFRPVNVDERGNEHFVDAYKLYTKALILSLVKDGKEVKHKNLDKIWQLARNRQKFIDYVTDEVSEFMEGTK
ncbi:MAG: nitrophenyl compound nitroreductase subunit ArsF family protein [bacterium]|nr:nitrophenyl compound nitroreductase subunit ArsF family protein [bacterium]